MKREIRSKLKHVVRKSARKAKSLIADRADYIYHIDSPKSSTVPKKLTTVDGWIIPKKSGLSIQGVRVVNGENIYQAKYGFKRADVASSNFRLDPKKALHSGFSVEFELEDDRTFLEVDFGKGYKRIKSWELIYSQEKLVRDYYNPNLAINYAEHQNLIENKKAYFYEEASEHSYARGKNDPKLLAFYLPQFHAIKENNEVWGEGFTEWTNVATATPRFVGHQQPLLPKDLGFYDLNLEQNIKNQIDLAKKYGIYGFCFYYYWFSGYRLLEKPLNSFLKHKEWDFNFAICWANENWTKRWDGRDNEIIVAQQYRDEDPLEFIKDVEHILTDSRYINENSKPVLLVYRASELKDPARYARVWREYFKDNYAKELQLVSVLSFDDQDPREYGFDAGLDFAPLTTFFKHRVFEGNKLPFIDVGKKLIDPNFEGVVADYREVALNNRLYEAFDFPTYKSVMPSWDNDARKKGKGFVYYGANTDIYSTWLDRVINMEKQKSKSPLIFINAWNEWAEGTVVEPSDSLGHSTLKRTAEVLALHSSNPENTEKFPLFEIKKNSDLAVVIHLYYPERWKQINNKLKVLDRHGYDLFITLNEKDKDLKNNLEDAHPNCKVIIVPNRGRDVLPFVILGKRLKLHRYKYVLKLHSKKSKHRDDGDEWFDDLIGKLLPESSQIIDDILKTLDREKTLIGPSGHIINLRTFMGSNETHMHHVLSKTRDKRFANNVINNSKNHAYIAGTMFWASFGALEGLFDLHLKPEDFEYEKGQIDGTLAHAIERTLSILPLMNKSKLYQSDGKVIREVTGLDVAKNYKFTK